MRNKYQVKIDDSVIPELYTFDQLIDEGLLDEVDENIKVRLYGENVWQTARNYPFADIEPKVEQQQNAASKSQGAYRPNKSIPNAINHEDSSVQYSRCKHNNKDVQRTMPEYPAIVDKWNWGAFGLSWIWGIFNGLYWPLLIIFLNFVPYIGLIVSICICVFLGKEGNRLAWKIARRRGRSIENFTNIQTKWNNSGIILLIIIVCTFLIVLIL